jgi:hypothetical protein
MKKRGRKPLTTASPGYVRYSRALELFSPLTKNQFTHQVNAGEIKTAIDEKGRMYELQSLHRVRNALLGEKTAPQTIIDWLQPSDIPAGLRLDISLYPDEIVEGLEEASVYQSWRKNNNQLTMGAFTKDRAECLAYLQLVPLEEQTILDILSGKRSENSIKPDEVLAYNRLGAYTLLGVSAACHPDYPDLLFRILDRMMEFWIEQYPERYITKVYAQAVSERGDMLIQHLFMAPRPDLAQNAYELNLARLSASKIVRRFQKRLAAKAPLPPELQSYLS